MSFFECGHDVHESDEFAVWWVRFSLFGWVLSMELFNE